MSPRRLKCGTLLALKMEKPHVRRSGLSHCCRSSRGAADGQAYARHSSLQGHGPKISTARRPHRLSALRHPRMVRAAGCPQCHAEAGLQLLARLPLAVAIAVVSLVAPTKFDPPKLLWNASPSVPIGLYMTVDQAPAKGHLAVIRLSDVAGAFASARGYLPAGALLIKPVAAASGDVVCRFGPLIKINARLRALAHGMDRRHRLLPRWRGCRYLTTSELFVLSHVTGSFDGRYFGPIERGTVRGTGVPIWTR